MENISINLSSYKKKDLENNFLVTNKTEIIVAFSYPLNHEYRQSFISKTGFTFDILVKRIIQKYKNIYEHEKEYGIWGHNFEDLFLENIKFKDGIYYLSIGS